MKRQYTNRRYLDALEKKVLVFDGAMGTSLQTQNLTAEHFGGEQYNGCNDYLVISYPEAVEKVHRSFMEAGVDVLETDTFRSNRITMKEYGLQDRIIEINKAAASLARRIADEYSGKETSNESQDSTHSSSLVTRHPRFVAGS
ncbi:MAG: homocysteine S-methyltransferase family protein, partial [Microthrixaceae bacterium]|nr:homocysteine S-methyltransferase family protein [Microthrixaceae bacterium]